MGSLTELTAFANTALTFTDNRPANVIFNWPTARDVDVTILTNTFTAERKIDIVEIIQPATALVEYVIDVSAVSGTTVSWSTIPAGCSVSVTNGVYVMSGIDSVDDWDIVAAPTITTPVTFNGSFIYTSSVKYTTSAGRQTKSWNVGTYIPTSIMSCAASMTVSAKRLRDPEQTEFTAVATVSALTRDDLQTFSFLVATAKRFRQYESSITSQFTTDLYQDIMNLTGPDGRIYFKNNTLDLFGTNTPYIRHVGGTSYRLEFTVSSSDALLSIGDGLPTTSIATVTGTQAEVNAVLDTIFLYPAYDNTSTITVTYKLIIDSVLDTIETFPVTYGGLGTQLNTQTYTFTASDADFEIPYDQIVYGQWEYLIVAGGGGGAAGGGGGGGQVLSASNHVLTYNNSLNFPIVVGNGGTRGNYEFNYVTGGSQTHHGSDGIDSSALGYIAGGGQGGRAFQNDDQSAATSWNYNGGESTNNSGTTVSGGSGAPIPPVVSGKATYTYAIGAGGGGAGSGQAGSNASITGYDGGDTDIPIYRGGDGGDGATNSITGTSTYYGGGGGGGGGYAGIDSPSNPDHIGRGGLGGGGDGSPNAGSLYQAEDGTANTGGGGGGGNNDFVFGPDTWKRPGNGGSGIVILKVSAR